MWKFLLHEIQGDVYRSSDTEVGWRSIDLAIKYDTEQAALDALDEVFDGGYYEIKKVFVK